MQTVKLPIGIEDFAEIRRDGFYYVDKIVFIKSLMDNWAKVNLFTCPHRFGKTLTLSMLKAFFEIGTDATLFDGLDIIKESMLCKQYMGKCPVIFISLKGVEGDNFDNAYDMLRVVVRHEIQRLRYVIEIPRFQMTKRHRLFVY
jgi:hypothetical protein